MIQKIVAKIYISNGKISEIFIANSYAASNHTANVSYDDSMQAEFPDYPSALSWASSWSRSLT